MPARGGSKRIPGKNIREFLGRPLISYPVRAAKESGIFDRIIVSTDSKEIARISVDAGAEVPFMRPAELSDDHTPTNPVLMHAIDWLRNNGTVPEFFCCMYANPFITAENLRESCRLMRERRISSVIPVATFPFPIFRAFKKTPAGNIEFVYPEYSMTRSQDLPEACHDVGQFYWCNTGKFIETGRMLQPDTLPYMIDRHLCQDLDNLEDWALAEKLFETFMRK